MPDIFEPLRIVGDRISKYPPIRQMDNPPCALVTLHPVANFHQRELEDANINYIARIVARLNAIAHPKWLPPQDK